MPQSMALGWCRAMVRGNAAGRRCGAQWRGSRQLGHGGAARRGPGGRGPEGRGPEGRGPEGRGPGERGQRPRSPATAVMARPGCPRRRGPGAGVGYGAMGPVPPAPQQAPAPGESSSKGKRWAVRSPGDGEGEIEDNIPHRSDPVWIVPGEAASEFPHRENCFPRSAEVSVRRRVRWQSGDAADCKSAYAGSIPARTSNRGRFPPFIPTSRMKSDGFPVETNEIRVSSHTACYRQPGHDGGASVPTDPWRIRHPAHLSAAGPIEANGSTVLAVDLGHGRRPSVASGDEDAKPRAARAMAPPAARWEAAGSRR